MGLVTQAAIERPIPGGQSEADKIEAMDSSSHSTNAQALQAESAVQECGQEAAVTSLPSAWYAPQQQSRDIRAKFRCVNLLKHLS